MIKLGITGGIGSGKSLVSRILKMMGVPVYIADAESKRLTNTSPQIKTALLSLFGEQIYEDNVLNKTKLASLIFSNEEYLAQVNRIIHPVVQADFVQWSNAQNASVVAMESAILFESGLNVSMDVVITVTAPAELRIRRVQERDNATRQQIMQRMSNQWSDEEKLKQSNFRIKNDEQQAVIPQIEEIVSRL